jgi:thiamine-monophosphate kinase
VILGIGDDAALLRPEPGWDWIVTCDAQVAGRHFLPDLMSARAIGRRAMTINLSDVAAMGGEPRHALVSLGLPGETTVAFVEDLYAGFLDALGPAGAAIVGGNFTGTGAEWFCDVTLIGRVEQGRALTRAGANPGDRIFVTGSPGRSAAGLEVLRNAADLEEEWALAVVDAYVRPQARLAAGRFLGACGGVTALIDLSDGLVGDLTRICESSGAPARIDAGRLPVDPALEEAARLFGRARWEWPLLPGDDYELLFTVRPEESDRVAEGLRGATGLPVTQIGEIVFGRAQPLVEVAGLPPGSRTFEGWDHFRSG